MKTRLNSSLTFPVRQKWFEVYPNGDERADETRCFERIIKGPRISPRIWVILDKWKTENTWNKQSVINGDCRGCQYHQTATYTYSDGQLVLRIIKYYN